MIVLITLGGKGERFKKEGYKLPKALIEVDNKAIIFHLLDNLNIRNSTHLIYIPYNKEYLDYNLENILKERNPKYKFKFKFLVLENQTRGAAETIYIALSKLFSNDIRYPINFIQMKEMFDKPILCLDSDNFYTNDIINEWDRGNNVFSILDYSDSSKFSYLETDEDNFLTNIVEKKCLYWGIRF
jgi:NDP-sugar pyrophosphorylase family protein